MDPCDTGPAPLSSPSRPPSPSPSSSRPLAFPSSDADNEEVLQQQGGGSGSGGGTLGRDDALPRGVEGTRPRTSGRGGGGDGLLLPELSCGLCLHVSQPCRQLVPLGCSSCLGCLGPRKLPSQLIHFHTTRSHTLGQRQAPSLEVRPDGVMLRSPLDHLLLCPLCLSLRSSQPQHHLCQRGVVLLGRVPQRQGLPLDRPLPLFHHLLVRGLDAGQEGRGLARGAHRGRGC